MIRDAGLFASEAVWSPILQERVNRRQLLVVFPESLDHLVNCLLRKPSPANQVDVVSPKVHFLIDSRLAWSGRYFYRITRIFRVGPSYRLRRGIQGQKASPVPGM